jgi:hypothetical protein
LIEGTNSNAVESRLTRLHCAGCMRNLGNSEEGYEANDALMFLMLSVNCYLL